MLERERGRSKRAVLLCSTRNGDRNKHKPRQARHTRTNARCSLACSAHGRGRSVVPHAVQLVQRRLEDVEEHPADGGRDDDEQQQAPVVVRGRRGGRQRREVLRGGGRGLRRARHPRGGRGRAQAQAGDHRLAAHAVQLVQRRLQDVVEHPADGRRHDDEQQLPAVVAALRGRRGRRVRHALRRQRRVRRRQRREEGARQRRGRRGGRRRRRRQADAGLLGLRDAEGDDASAGGRRRARHDPGRLQQRHRGYGRHGWCGGLAGGTGLARAAGVAFWQRERARCVRG
ncbi:hypothetical protein BS78_07G024300 [Paspalum vaginatum]|nr:hypothetical protein BS78_07G024300 [Paspalum vaginatum]